MGADARGTWVPQADGSGFGIENLPYGVVRRGGDAPRAAVRVGEYALDLACIADAGLLDVAGLDADVLRQPTLNAFIEAGSEVWAATRARLRQLLSAEDTTMRDAEGLAERALTPLHRVQTLLPVAIGDYVDFFSSIEHAANVGRILRPEGEPLMPNWRHLPVAYHGRAGTIVVSGTPIRRPCGQRAPDRPGQAPTLGPERQLDYELELGFITGRGPALGTPLAAADAARHIFGFVLVSDWSAREIQRWETRPLGPFLGKSFATSVSAWIVPLDALAPLRVAGVTQDPPPLQYLSVDEPWALDVDLEVLLATGRSQLAQRISATNARGLYWNAAQQLAHATVNGASVRAGDLFASGTVSGAEPGSYGSLLELTWGGRDPLPLAGGVARSYLGDGDTVVLRGVGGGDRGSRGGALIRFGEVRGTILPAG